MKRILVNTLTSLGELQRRDRMFQESLKELKTMRTDELINQVGKTRMFEEFAQIAEEYTYMMRFQNYQSQFRFEIKRRIREGIE